MFRERGIVEVRAGHDLIGAELLWGAVARAPKAVAERRAWRHGSHRYVVRSARRLASETGRQDIWEGMRAANALHIYFYETNLQPESLRERIASANHYVESMKLILFAEDEDGDTEPAYSQHDLPE